MMVVESGCEVESGGGGGVGDAAAAAAVPLLLPLPPLPGSSRDCAESRVSGN